MSRAEGDVVVNARLDQLGVRGEGVVASLLGRRIDNDRGFVHGRVWLSVVRHLIRRRIHNGRVVLVFSNTLPVGVASLLDAGGPSVPLVATEHGFVVSPA